MSIYSSRFEFVGGRERRRFLHPLEPARVDRQRDGAEEAKTVLKVPNARAGEGVPIQRVRLQAEAVGAGPESESDRAAGKSLKFLEDPTTFTNQACPLSSPPRSRYGSRTGA